MKLIALFFVVFQLVFVYSQCNGGSTCSSCVKLAGCGWCDSSSQCLPGNYTSSLNGECENGTCWSFGSSATCPDDCSEMGVCTDCISKPNCFWCGKSHKCMFSIGNDDGHTPTPCTNQTCGNNSPDDCWKGNSSTYSFTKNCPSVSYCSNLTDCNTCTKANCWWCGTSVSCLEVQPVDSPLPCGYNNEVCSACLKGSGSLCPSVRDCKTINNCFDCATAGCGWCDAFQICTEYDEDNSPCTSCHIEDSCYLQNPQLCPNINNSPVNCSMFDGNCSACSNVTNCGYCLKTNQCLTSYYGSSCDVGDECELVWANGGSCTKERDYRVFIYIGIGVAAAIAIGVLIGVACCCVRKKAYRGYEEIKGKESH